MEDQKTENKVEEPFTQYGRYTYADYLTWELDQMVELIKGKVYRFAAAPRTNHQRVSARILARLFNFLRTSLLRFFQPPLMFVYPANL